jgi:hypothetical protein
VEPAPPRRHPWWLLASVVLLVLWTMFLTYVAALG